MVELTKPFPPGDYPVVIVGSGPGGIQTSYCLSRLGVAHAVISADEAPGGMFQRFPLFQRLISWTKPHAPFERGSREYERFDHNSLISDESRSSSVLPDLMDGVSYFPSRLQMHAGIVRFAEKVGVEVRYGCSWESTRRTDDRFALVTTDGEYTCRVAIFAVGMTTPWKPKIPGIEEVPHYVDTRPAEQYAGKRVFIIGKRNSGFEVADGLLPWARQIILGSPRPAVISVVSHSTASARARYLQPYEDHVLGGGNLVLDAAIERIDRTGDGWRVFAGGTTIPGDYVFDVDEVIAATGFATPMLDLPELGVATFYQGGRLPAQTPFWESPSVPGIYFAGNITQGSIGLKKYGIPSNSGAVHGFRYNCRVLAAHVATHHFGKAPTRTPVPDGEVVDLLLSEAARGPELWNQMSYLCRAISFDPDGSAMDEGVQPLAHFVDASGPDAVAITIETDSDGDIHPAVYVRRAGKVDDHVLASDPLLTFDSAEHRSQLSALLKG